MGKLVARDKLSDRDARALLGRITPVGEYAPMAEAEMIIEAATEHEEIKHRDLQDRRQGARPTARSWPATPARSRSPAWPASAPDPARFIGLHFFNPVPVMGLIEVIPGLATSAETIARTRALAEALGKEVVLARTSPASSSTAS